MSAPWFDPNLAWIPGTAFGIAGGLFGVIVGTLMPLSRLKKRLIGMNYIKTAYFIFIGSSFAMFVAGLIAFFSAQPYGIWYGLGFPGLIGLIVFGSLYPLVFRLPRNFTQ